MKFIRFSSKQMIYIQIRYKNQNSYFKNATKKYKSEVPIWKDIQKSTTWKYNLKRQKEKTEKQDKNKKTE